MLNRQSFFFQRENCSLFLIVFLDRLYFYDVATLLFYARQFSFSSWKSLSVPYWFHLIYISAFLAVFFFVCVEFSRNKQSLIAISFIFLRCDVIFSAFSILFFLWKSLFFDLRDTSFPTQHLLLPNLTFIPSGQNNFFVKNALFSCSSLMSEVLYYIVPSLF